MIARSTTGKSMEPSMEEEDSDYSWQPPSEAEMKIIRARRERDNKISQRMGDYLLKGYKMLGTVCNCGTILLQDRQGCNYCIACSELDSDTDKDDPVRNQEAALAQVREQELSLRQGSEESVDQSLSSPAVPQSVPEQSSRATTTTTTQSMLHPTPTGQDRVTSTIHSGAQGLNDLAAASVRVVSSDMAGTCDILNKKLSWATEELQKTVSVEYSIQLCQLIKHCADAIHSLKAAG